MRQTVTLPRWLVEAAAQCIAKAEAEGAFTGCAVPSIGRKTLAALHSHIAPDPLLLDPAQLLPEVDA